MDNYELIKKVVNLENKLEDLSRELTGQQLMFVIFIVGCALFFFGCLMIMFNVDYKKKSL